MCNLKTSGYILETYDGVERLPIIFNSLKKLQIIQGAHSPGQGFEGMRGYERGYPYPQEIFKM